MMISVQTVRCKVFCLVLFLLSSFSVTIFAANITPAENIYHKDRLISFDFQSIELKSLLQLIAKSSGLNFVISDTVTGSITLKLKNVTWEQALDIVMKSRGLASRRIGNVVYISTIEDIAGNEAKLFQSQEQLSNLAPLESKIVCLKYTNSKELAELLKGSANSLLTPRGQVAVDSRTNCVIIRDVHANIKDIMKAVNRLDIPAKQVLIEARIVNIDVMYEEQVGVRFGISNTRHLSGSLQAANEITGGTTPSSVTNVAGVVDPTQRLNFNVPAAQLFDGASPGSIALALARIGSVLLDLELSALEAESHAKVIAKPHVVTSNQQKAIIATGEEIPYQQSTSSGATSVAFKNALLSLEIVPQITPNDKIILHIKATEDSRGASVTIGSSATAGSVTIPAINTQEVESSILLNNNETVVIGGVYKLSKSNVVDRVPFFGSLPWVGFLFRHTDQRDEKHELLIFVTPKIIDNTNQLAATNHDNLLHQNLKGEG